MPRKPRDPEINSHAAEIARAAWAVPSDRYAVRFSARIPKVMAEEFAGQNSSERGDVWADGVRVRKALPRIIDLVNEAAGLEYPSYIVGDDGVTVVWGQWSATASTTVEAVLMLLDEIFPDGECSPTEDLRP